MGRRIPSLPRTRPWCGRATRPDAGDAPSCWPCAVCAVPPGPAMVQSCEVALSNRVAPSSRPLAKMIVPFGAGAGRSAAAEVVNPVRAARASVQTDARRVTARPYTLDHGRRVRESRGVTRTLAGLVVVGAGMLALPTAGQAATTFGSRLLNDPSSSGECVSFPNPCTIASFIHPTDPNGDPSSAGAPVGGVITMFRIRAHGEGGAGAKVTFRLASVSRPDPERRLGRRDTGGRRADRDDPGEQCLRHADPGVPRPRAGEPGESSRARRDERPRHLRQQRRQVQLRVQPAARGGPGPARVGGTRPASCSSRQ